MEGDEDNMSALTKGLEQERKEREVYDKNMAIINKEAALNFLREKHGTVDYYN